MDSEIFEKLPRAKLFFRLAIPSMITMMFGALYQIADGLFVGRFIGEDALAAEADGQALVLTSWRLPDMTGPELAKKLPAAGVMMIVPGDYDPAELEDLDVLTLHNPISQDALIQAVRAMCYCGAKLQALSKKALKLERQLAERKVIERAKGRLMDALNLSEKDAHYHIQKKSMDTGRRIVDVAQEILDSEEIVA